MRDRQALNFFKMIDQSRKRRLEQHDIIKRETARALSESKKKCHEIGLIGPPNRTGGMWTSAIVDSLFVLPKE